MGALTQYAIQAALLLTALYLLYKLALAGSRFHRFNRRIIMGLYLLAFMAFPLYDLLPQIHGEISAEAAMEEMREEVRALVDTPAPLWPRVLGMVYLCGVLVATFITIRNATRIFRIIKEGTHDVRNGYILVVTGRRGISPFSWGKYIVVPTGCSGEDLEMTMAHEMAHLRHRHWIDLAVGQLAIILNWFNPAAYLMMRELQDAHEFEVDSDLISYGIDRRRYQMLLLRNATGSFFSLMVDGLNHSQLKDRLRVMMEPPGRQWRKVLCLLTLPVMAGVMAGMSTREVASRLAAIGGASAFAKEYDDVRYIEEDNRHSILYFQDGNQSGISMDLPQGVEPRIYIDRHLASRAELRRLKSDRILFVVGDSRLQRFVIKTK